MVDETPLGDNEDENLGGRWRKSSYSMSNGHCVETAQLASGIAVRDSHAVAAGSPILHFGPGAWVNFLNELRAFPSL